MKAYFRVFLAVGLLWLAAGSQASAGDELYDRAARNFLDYLGSEKEIASFRVIEGSALDANAPPIASACRVNLTGGGYILLQTSTFLTPIKAYSLKGDFDTLPPAVQAYLLLETESNARAAAAAGRLPFASQNQSRWDFLLNFDGGRFAQSDTAGQILLRTTWNQNHPYNKFLPMIDGETVLAGCVNVAMGQVMKFHGHPAAGQGVAFHRWEAGVQDSRDLKAVLYRSYNWADMPDALALDTPAHQIDEVARLIRDLGVANNTDFGLDNSGAVANVNALIDYFGYDPDIRFVDNTDPTAFFDVVQAEIDGRRPLLLSLPGHMAVLDGYGTGPEGDKIHLNLGWGGHDDDFFYLDQNIQAGNYIYPPDLEAYYNIQPCSGEACFRNLEAGDTAGEGTITGRFDFPRDADRYPVYLKGATTIGGSRGYSNQAFYISVSDSGHVRVAAGDTPLSLDLPADRYTIRVSLFNEINGSYTYNTDFADYTVTVGTQTLTAAEKSAVDAGLDHPPMVYNDFENLLLDAGTAMPHRILIDVRDADGDPIDLSIGNTNPGAVQAVLDGHVLVLTPSAGASGTSAKITVTASARGREAAAAFIVMTADQRIGFGKSIEVAGLFESQEDVNTHPVILSGACNIIGSKPGFDDQYFFLSVQDGSQNTLHAPNDTAVGGTFSEGIYFLGASLSENPGGAGRYYEYQQDYNDQYRINVSCPDADDSAENIARLLGIDLSGTIESVLGDVNDDQSVDLTDAVLTLQVLSGLEPGLRGDVAAGRIDVDADGMLEMEDLIYILRAAAGLS